LQDVLIRNADVVVTMDATRRELAGADVVVRGGEILAVGAGLQAPGADVIDARGCVVPPGLVNTHHHLYQSLTRAVPGGQDALLFGWLQTLYPIRARFGPEEMFVSAQVGLAELALSGCSLTADHLYLYPNGARLEDTIHAAREVGLRFHPTRGAMSIGVSDGGLPPDSLVETEAAILNDMIRVVDAFHDARPGSMCRVGLAPCSPFSVSRDLMRDTALLARDKGVMLHTHLAENDEDVAYSLARFGVRPGQYAQDLGWTGPDVWHAHCVKLDASEIALFARTRTGVAHCPCSNCRLGSGIAPVRAMRDAGVPVGLGVDGSASNDAGNLIAETRQPCCCNVWRAGPMPWARVRRWRSPRWAARRCWGEAIAGRWCQGCGPMWRSGICRGSRRQGRGTRSPPLCCARLCGCAICWLRGAGWLRAGRWLR
jgi:cytosine/adenosine deaminase-related metal-dependent hydrolase